MAAPLTLVIFDLLRRDGVDLTRHPYIERRQELESLKLDGQAWTTCERFDDGQALFTGVCDLGLEGGPLGAPAQDCFIQGWLVRIVSATRSGQSFFTVVSVSVDPSSFQEYSLS
jgi:hypothetical protein